MAKGKQLFMPEMLSNLTEPGAVFPHFILNISIDHKYHAINVVNDSPEADSGNKLLSDCLLNIKRKQILPKNYSPETSRFIAVC